MSLKTLPAKLYAGIAVAAAVMWMAGVSGATILPLALFGAMVVMHLDGHGSHGAGSGASHGTYRPADAAGRTPPPTADRGHH